MRLYDNAPSSNYEELKTFYPVWYREVLEMDAIWHALGRELDGVQGGIITAVNNCFVNTADEATIARLEDFLYINYEGKRTLEERRALVASFFIGNGHIGEREIKELMLAFTSGDVTVDLVGGTVEISVTREISDRFNLADSTFVILKRIPAHLNVAFNDILLPIRFRNKTGLTFRKFGVGVSAFNGGKTTPIFLDGQRTLDGSWTLAQMFRGIILRSVSFETSFVAHRAIRAPSLAFSPMPIRNNPSNRFEAFSARTEAHNDNSLFYQAAAFGASFRQPQGITATITMDSMYRLDGTALLDGSRKLNAKIEKEDI